MADPANELTPDEIEEFKGLTQQEIYEELSDGPSFNAAVYRCMRACNREIKKKRIEIGMDEDDEGSVRSAANPSISAVCLPSTAAKTSATSSPALPLPRCWV